jgi:amino acid permease
MKTMQPRLQATLTRVRALSPRRDAAPKTEAHIRFAMARLDATDVYWFLMFAASALGTNMGDFWVDDLALDRGTSFASLAALSGLAIWISGKPEAAGEFAFWVAIVTLRAAATNVGDLLTHDLRFSYTAISIILGVTTLLAGRFTRRDATKRQAPAVDHRYWITMFIAGTFGTVAGDLSSHALGLYIAAAMLCVLLLAALALRSSLAPSSIIGY